MAAWSQRLACFARSRGSMSGSVFVVASGPSAQHAPLAAYRHVPMIAMNGSVLRLQQDGIRPFYYLCDDPSFIEGRPELAQQGVASAQHLAMSADSYQQAAVAVAGLAEHPSRFLLQRVNRHQGSAIVSDRRYAWSIRRDAELHCGFSLLSAKPNRIGFSCNLGKGYFGARTAPFVALQLARHLGFSRVFLVGVDLDASRGRFYERGDGALPSSLDEDFPDYILPSFRMMAARVVTAGLFEVYNLSADSRLPNEVVPKITLAQLQQLSGEQRVG